MSTREETPATASAASAFSTPPVKKLRFRGDLNMHHFGDSRLEDIFDEPDGGIGRRGRNNATQPPEQTTAAKGLCVCVGVIGCAYT